MIQGLRETMLRHGIHTYIVTKFDPHASEYSHDHWNGIKFLTGFTGSAGTLVVTKDRADLWVDGRYFIQAERQVSKDITIQKIGQEGVKDYPVFVADETSVGGVIGFDGRTMSYESAKQLIELVKYKNISLRCDLDLVGEIWPDRPSLPKGIIFVHEERFCGKSHVDKLNQVREKMKKDNADTYIISSLDDIAWLFNLRGDDIKNCTLFASYAVIDEHKATLFVDKDKLGHIGLECVVVDDYHRFYDYINEITNQGRVIAINLRQTNYALHTRLNPKELRPIEIDYTTTLKAVKNETELNNLEKVNIKDGVAMVRLIKWLKEEGCKSGVTEYDIDDKLLHFRKQGENFMYPSFSTIAAYMDNGPLMHYSALADDCKTIEPSGFLLVDSGGQYLDGTTDITRTIALGQLTDQMITDFTLVLKSHIGLASAVFLYGATGSNLDILARKPLWDKGIDYKCGTGHGIGFCLNVHEGPQGISQRPSFVVLEPGMLITNEPGIYRDNEYGIRTENTVLVSEHQTTPFGRFMRFETISYCPIDLDAVNPSLLTQEEKAWLNNYHKTVYEKLSPCLNEEEKAWLLGETREV